jgi:hypothetical protein
MAAQELTQGYEMMAKDPGLGNMFGQKQRYEMLHDIAKLKGFNRFSAYLDPDAPPPQPDPLKVRELDIKDRRERQERKCPPSTTTRSRMFSGASGRAFTTTRRAP